MKKMKFNKITLRALAASCVLGLFMAAQSAAACTLQNWSGGISGAVAPGSPNPDTTVGEVQSPRYSGLCAMQADGQGFVQDDSPGSINRIIARFYVLVDPNVFSGSAEVYAGFSSDDGSGKLFSVTVDDAGNVTLADTATGASISEQSSTNWLSVEIDWFQDGGSGELNLIVNGTAAVPATGLNNAGSGTALRSVQLGNLDGGGSGPLKFDAYESRRSTAVGRLLAGDANNDGNIDALDRIVLRNEILTISLAGGQPDCNEDGSINALDRICLRNEILGV